MIKRADLGACLAYKLGFYEWIKKETFLDIVPLFSWFVLSPYVIINPYWLILVCFCICVVFFAFESGRVLKKIVFSRFTWGKIKQNTQSDQDAEFFFEKKEKRKRPCHF